MRHETARLWSDPIDRARESGLNDNKRFREDPSGLALARDVQRASLPRSLPRVAGYRFFASYRPAGIVGGDFYDLAELPNGRVLACVGDVMGKGVAAALLMARVSAELRLTMRAGAEPHEALELLHQSLCTSRVEHFVTLLVMVIDPIRSQLRVANAGHMPALLRRDGGELVAVGNGTVRMPLNVSLDPRYGYRTSSFEIEPGSCLVAYTDGLTEACGADGDMFGEGRVCDVLARTARDARGAGEDLLDALRGFAARPLGDDLTIVCFSREPASPWVTE